MEKTTLQTAIMFSDVAGSSALYKKLGDMEANAAVSKCVSMMMEEVESNRGHVIKTIGDEVMSRFESAADACLAAVTIQRRSKKDMDLAIRIGLDYGAAIFEGNDVFGQVVNDAAAVSHVASGEQIVITQNVFDQLPQDVPYSAKLYDAINLKGSPRETNVYRIEWEEKQIEGTTFFNVNDIDPTLLETERVHTLRLDHKQNSIELTKENTPFTIGRKQEHCDLVIDTDLVSRKHLEIVFRRGKFVLVDKSTNGTYVSVKGSAPIYLRREELPLTESGQISLGKKIEPADENLLTFHT